MRIIRDGWVRAFLAFALLDGVLFWRGYRRAEGMVFGWCSYQLLGAALIWRRRISRRTAYRWGFLRPGPALRGAASGFGLWLLLPRLPRTGQWGAGAVAFAGFALACIRLWRAVRKARRGMKFDLSGDWREWYDLDDGYSTMRLHQFVREQGFPTVTQLRQGILLCCIAHAVYLGHNGDMFAHNHHWEGNVYLEDNDQGEQWAVAFGDEGAVAVFFSSESDRNPYPEDSPPYDQDRYFAGMPPRLAKLKEQALSWMYDLDWVVGGPNAVITSVMWANGEQFTGAEPWADVFDHSGQACYWHLLPLDLALIEWQNYFGLEDEQVHLVRSLYERKLASPNEVIKITPEEREIIVPGPEHLTRSQSGRIAAQAALAAIGIALFDDAG